MDPVSIVSTILSLIPDLISTRGGRLIAGKYIAGKYFSTTALEKINPIGGARYRRVLKNPWLQFLRKIRTFIRNEYKVTLPPKERFKIASEMYKKLKASGQLENVLKHHGLPLEIVEILEANLVIRPKYDRKKLLSVSFATPATPLEPSAPSIVPSAPPLEPSTVPTITLPPEVHYAYEPPPSLFPPFLEPEAEARKRAVYERIHEHAVPSMAVTFVPSYFPPGAPGAPSAPQQLEEVQRNVAQETISETVQKTLNSLPAEAPTDTKAQVIKENIQNVQQQLVAEGNLQALSPEVVKEGAKDAGIAESSKDKEAIAQAASEVTGEHKEDIKDEMKEKEQLAKALAEQKEEKEKKVFCKP
jgi:hypothetical protein